MPQISEVVPLAEAVMFKLSAVKVVSLAVFKVPTLTPLVTVTLPEATSKLVSSLLPDTELIVVWPLALPLTTKLVF